MKKKIVMLFAALMALSMTLTGCGEKKEAEKSSEVVVFESAQASEKSEEQKPSSEEASKSESQSSEESSKAESSESSEAAASSEEGKAGEKTGDLSGTLVALNGPTAMALVNYVKDHPNTKFEKKTVPEDVVQALVQGKVDVASVPANMASVLYNKTEGKVVVLGITVENVLTFVENVGDGKPTVSSLEDLKGKTIYMPGQGATPQAVLELLLKKHGIDPNKDVTIVYCSEAPEAGARVLEEQGAIGFLPQPFATAIQLKSKGGVKPVLDLPELWKAAYGENASIVTGVLVARREYVEKHADEIPAFLDAVGASVAAAKSDVKGTAKLIEDMDIVKGTIAEKAMPKTDLVWIDGADMKAKLGEYLKLLAENNPKLVGGKVPDDAFYYGK